MTADELALANEFASNKNTQTEFKISNSGKILIGLTGGIGLGLTIICTSFVAPAFRKHCLPYVPATTAQIKNVLSVLPQDTKNKALKLLDIGSGDGRIVISAAKHGIISHGVELNPWLVYYSRFSALRCGVFQDTKFFRKDLWKFNTKNYKFVTIFGVEQMMSEVEEKLLKELPSDATIIACRFPFPTLIPFKIIEGGVDTVWIYNINKITK